MTYELYHHGILGQKWGVRRYQNEDGTWTDAGKSRYGDIKNDIKQAANSVSKMTSDITDKVGHFLSTDNGKIVTEVGKIAVAGALTATGLITVPYLSAVAISSGTKALNLLAEKINNITI